MEMKGTNIPLYGILCKCRHNSDDYAYEKKINHNNFSEMASLVLIHFDALEIR